MNLYHRLSVCLLSGTLVLGGCGGSSSSSSTMPAQAQSARVRFVDGAPELEALVGGTPQSICSASAPCYLQVNGETVSELFSYGSMTPFVSVAPGTLSLVARDEAGYAVGPLKTTALTPGARYTLIVVGTYPNYSVLTFEEPASTGKAQLSLYEASPTVSQSAFGSFRASSHSDFKQLGSAKLGTVATVTLGEHVSNFGGYAGATSKPFGAFTPAQIDSFDKHNVLPFHVVGRLSLFLFDPKSQSSTNGPVFASLDK
jgi:hypothetical protein